MMYLPDFFTLTPTITEWATFIAWGGLWAILILFVLWRVCVYIGEYEYEQYLKDMRGRMEIEKSGPPKPRYRVGDMVSFKKNMSVCNSVLEIQQNIQHGAICYKLSGGTGWVAEEDLVSLKQWMEFWQIDADDFEREEDL